MNRQSKDLLIGFSRTILIPIAALIVVYIYDFKGYSIVNFLGTAQDIDLIVPVSTVGLVPVVLWYFVLVNRGVYKKAQGQMLAILVWVFIILGSKFL